MLMSNYEKIKTDVSHISQLTKQLAKDDPRRIVHSIKVGFAITLVSLFFYFDPLYEGLGMNAMWAVLTVVVVFEFSVGATLGKGVNRGLATIIGGMSGFGAHRLSSLSGDKLEPFFLGFSVFITAGVTTFMRFFPKVKARFDYGLLVFILTFCLICVSGYRDDQVIDMAHRRITTILIGSSTAVIVCLIICPVWAGTDLHNLVSTNILTLSLFFQGFGIEYFKTSLDITPSDDEIEDNKSSLQAIKSVLNSKNNIDTLLNYARWEFRHGRFKKGHPWTQYQKIGELVRNCACRAEALHSFLYSQGQAPNEVKAKFLEPCMKMSTESGNCLSELSMAIKKMNKPSKAKPHLQNAKQAVQNLNVLLTANIWKNLNLSDVTPVATVAKLLADVVACTEDIAEAVQELASLAKFKDAKEKTKVAPQIEKTKVAPQIEKTKMANNQGSIKRRPHANHVILIETSSPTSSPRISVPKDPPSLAMAQQAAE
ncbi:aluminum-activated malate transporter 2 [Spinacia oleracea]|uniref:Aluminum-activated malate transporter 2 n=1 Tax=Spinacia oleracea TaxID=3562 RepID=A0A9R0HTJ2_SPIOL|nr:aluminum-activated malate transporter 2-like [Spinacia oleracea]